MTREPPVVRDGPEQPPPKVSDESGELFEGPGPNDNYVDENGRTVVESVEHLQRMTREAKAELAAAERDWREMQDEARRTGIPPGWLR